MSRAPSPSTTGPRPSDQPQTSKQTGEPPQRPQPPEEEHVSHPVAQETRSVREPEKEDLRHRIAERAYRLYVADGFPEGRALEHWLQAEREVASERQEWDH